MEAKTDRAAVLSALKRLGTDREPLVSSRLRVIAEPERLQLVTFDREQLRTTIIAATVTDPGMVTLPYRIIEEWIRNEDSADVHMRTDSAACTLVAGSARIQLQHYSFDDWPKVAHCTGSSLQLGPRFLHDLGRVARSAAEDDSRAQLSGVAVGNGCIAATDTYRLAAAEAPDFSGDIIVVPKGLIRVALSLSQGLDCEVRLCEGHMTLDFGHTLVTSTLIQGDFPKWRDAIPQTEPEGSIEVDRLALLTALRRLSPIGSQAPSKAVQLIQDSSGRLKLWTAAPDVGLQEEYVEGTMSRDGVAFNIPHLKDLVEVLSTAKLELALHPSMAIAQEPGFIGLVMLVRSVSPQPN